MDTKEPEHYLEDFDKKVNEHDVNELPASLQSLSADEVHKLGLKTTTRLDLIVMPALVIMYILYVTTVISSWAEIVADSSSNYLDRQNIAASKLANIMRDLDMSVTQYNTAVSILFVGYSERRL
jgi:hypothetical protein